MDFLGGFIMGAAYADKSATYGRSQTNNKVWTQLFQHLKIKYQN